jgi:hypothetical protein
MVRYEPFMSSDASEIPPIVQEILTQKNPDWSQVSAEEIETASEIVQEELAALAEAGEDPDVTYRRCALWRMLISLLRGLAYKWAEAGPAALEEEIAQTRERYHGGEDDSAVLRLYLDDLLAEAARLENEQRTACTG